MTIKVGQIYSNRCKHNHIIACVTKIKGNGKCCCINQKGTIRYCFFSDFKKYTLIAEYPTWQEAVNSKEFNK